MEATKIIYIYPYMLYLFENPRTRTLQWWPLQLILVTSKPNQTKQCIFTPTWYTFLKTPDQGHCNGDLCSWFGWAPNQTKPNNAYLPLHDIPFWKHQTKNIAMLTSAADLGDLQTKPNKTYLSLIIIYFWKCQKNDNEMVTSENSHKSGFYILHYGQDTFP